MKKNPVWIIDIVFTLHINTQKEQILSVKSRSL